MIHYFKNYQYNELWNYYKVMTDRDPPGCEVINFLNERPMIEFREYRLEWPGDRIDYNAFWEAGERITAEEYQAAYERATSGPFSLLINGRMQG